MKKIPVGIIIIGVILCIVASIFAYWDYLTKPKTAPDEPFMKDIATYENTEGKG